MQNSNGTILAVVFPILFAAGWVVTGYGVAFMGGWWTLAKRFRLQGEFSGAKWSMQSAKMRFNTRYNNALTIGANNTGLFLVPLVLFRIGHPPLLIPWTEISNVRTVTVLFFFRFTEMRLGRTEQIPFRIRLNLAEQLQAVTGPAWPAGNTPWEVPPPPPPIG